LNDDIDKMLLQYPDSPTLFCYCNDGWSGTITERTVERLGDKKVVRQGKVRREFLIENGFLRLRTPFGEDKFALLFGSPRPLRSGKAAWNVFTSSCEFSNCCVEKDAKV